MAVEVVEGCRVRWHDAVAKVGTPRSLARVTVRRVSPGMVEWTRPQSGVLVRKRLSGTKLEIHGPDGTDLVALWRGAPLGRA